MTWDRAEIDEAYARFAENMTAFADVVGTFEDPDGIQRMRVTRLEVETPVEMDLRVAKDGNVTLGAAPPVYRTETTILPVFHNLRITLEPGRGAS